MFTLHLTAAHSMTDAQRSLALACLTKELGERGVLLADTRTEGDAFYLKISEKSEHGRWKLVDLAAEAALAVSRSLRAELDLGDALDSRLWSARPEVLKTGA